MHPDLLKEYAEFCDIREVRRESNTIKFHESTNFYPAKQLPLYDFLATIDKNLVLDHALPTSIAIIPRDQQQANTAFEYICTVHQNEGYIHSKDYSKGIGRPNFSSFWIWETLFRQI